MRNTDGTTERIDLREARVLRRVLDLEALVEEQTVVVEPEPPESEESVSGEPESEEGTPSAPLEEELPETDVEPSPAEAAPETEALPEEAAQDVPAAEIEGAPVAESEEPAAPERPALQIPPFGGEPVASLDSEALGETLSYEEALSPSWIGKRVQYAVVYVNGKNRLSPLSPVASIEPRPPLSPPADVEARAGDGFVRVEWRAPSPSAAELGYAVFRRAESEAEFPEVPLAGAPVLGTSFEDRAVVFGSPVCYAVKTSWLPPEPVEAQEDAEEAAPEPDEEPETYDEPPELREEAEPEPNEQAGSDEQAEVLVPLVPPIAGPQAIESELSAEVCITPEDVFPPPAPTDLVAVPAPSGTLLTWRVVEAPDLAGYRVYRSEQPNGGFELLGEVTVGSYRDAESAPGRRYYYAVTAIDDTARVNESDRTEVVEAVRPEPR